MRHGENDGLDMNHDQIASDSLMETKGGHSQSVKKEHIRETNKSQNTRWGARP